MKNNKTIMQQQDLLKIQRGRVLLLLTYCYPYNPPREIFLHEELTYLSKEFDHVLIIPTSRINKNDNVYHINNVNSKVLNLKRKRRIIELISGFIRQCLFNGVFWKSFSKLVFIEKNKMAKIHMLLNDYAKNDFLFRSITKCLSNEIAFSSNVSFLVYSYWLNSNASLAVMISNFIMQYHAHKTYTISRAHGLGDLYLGYRPKMSTLINGLHRIFPISNSGKKYLIESGFKEEQVFVSRLGVNAVARKTDYSKKNCYEVVSCSMLTKNKRVSLIVDALSTIKDINIKWTHFGDGEERETLIERCKKRLSANIEYSFMGSTKNDRIINYYIENDPLCIINVSLVEGIPVSIMEAFSCGIPAIATDVGATSELVANEINGYLLSQNFSDSDLAFLIQKMCRSERSIINSLKESAYNTWNSKYNAKKNYTDFARLCKELVD
ncbi:MAG: glycosyltransferase [Bacilli bacterium]|jgi:glycosyltransferase involved in cell wall biosynthesis|nr:glycosyltransferase [Bacilli bacterium]